MKPIGQYIKIQPHPLAQVSGLIVDKTAIVPGTALEISPDIDVPFKPNATVFYFISRQIALPTGTFIHIDHCHCYKN